MQSNKMEGLASASFDEQDAGSGPVHSSPSLGPMTAALHNISARHLHEIGLTLPDDRQFLRSWRKQLQECLNTQNARIVRFLLTDVSGSTTISDADITQRCLAVINKYSKPTWKFASSIRDLTLNSGTVETQAQIATELGISPSALRDTLKRAIRIYVNSAAALSAAEIHLEEKLKRLEAVSERVSNLMFLEPTASLEPLGEATRKYLDSVLEKIDLEADYRELAENFKKFTVLRSMLSLGSFQRSPLPTCSICMTRDVAQAVTPCGHTFCEECCRTQMTACYICRVQIRDKIKLYFA